MLPKIATQKYDMIVPSTGKSITYRPYVVREEKLLLIALESQDDKQIETAVSSIIKSCLDNVKTQDLTAFDIEFIFLTLRSRSVGEGIELGIECTACEESNPIKLNLDNIQVKNLDFDDKDLQLKLNNEITIELRWPTMSDRTVKVETGTEVLIHMVAKSISTLYHGEEVYSMKDVPFTEVLDFVESLNSEQFNKIMQLLLKTPYVSYDIEFTCKKCGEKNERELKGLADFFQ